MPQIVDLGTLKRVTARDVWSNEARDFTPWLAQNLAMLGEAIGIELELLTQESPVGSFSLDLLAKDVGRDRLVVIENQLEATNHDHLGKLLTYAAGHDAGVMVWVAREFRDEHRQALDWLNQHTDSTIECFAVVVEVMQIDDSRPACVFRQVAFPNEWRKKTIEKGEGGGISQRREAYRSFFQSLLDELRDTHHFTGARIAQPQNWYSFASGISGLTYGLSFAQDASVRAELYIDLGDAGENKSAFDRLLADKNQIEQQFGEPLQWERLDTKRASRIAVYRPGSIDDDAATLADIKAWSVAKLLRFKTVFAPRLDQLTP